MPTTHILKNSGGNLWYLSTPEGVVVDSVIAPNHAEAAVAVQHLLPRDGAWQSGAHGAYIYQTPSRVEVLRRARRF